MKKIERAFYRTSNALVGITVGGIEGIITSPVIPYTMKRSFDNIIPNQRKIDDIRENKEGFFANKSLAKYEATNQALYDIAKITTKGTLQAVMFILATSYIVDKTRFITENPDEAGTYFVGTWLLSNTFSALYVVGKFTYNSISQTIKKNR